MKMLNRVFLTLAMASSLETFAGNSIGNGVPNYSDQLDAAWFTDAHKTIGYCIDLSPNFGVSLADSQKAIEQAQGMWRFYIISRGVNDGNIKLTTSWQQHPKCTGSEDLRFILGGKEPDQISSGDYENLAKSVKSNFDLKSGWAKGYIWVASSRTVHAEQDLIPSWEKPNHLVSVILHELGHVYGCGHIDGTIMDERLSLAFRFDNQNSLGSIDQTRVLFWNQMTPYILPGTLGTDIQSSDPSGSATIFKKLIGREPKGNIQAVYENEYGTLVVSDDLGRFEINLQTGISPGQANYSFKVAERRFFRMREMQAGGYEITGTQPFGWVQYMTVRTPTGSFLVSVVVNSQNMGLQGPIAIDLIDGDMVRGLFRSYPYNGRY